MNKEKVITQPHSVNNSSSFTKVSDVTAWVHAQERKSDMDSLTARLRITALEQLAQLVANDEPKDDVQWMLDHMNQLRERWARRHQDSKAATAQSYASRASATIREYFRWSEAPDKYTPSKKRKNLTEKPSYGVKNRNKPPLDANVVNEAIPINKASEVLNLETNILEQRRYSFGEKRGSIIFQLPTEGIDFTDVKKFTVHLLTLAKDFDVSNPEQAQIFSIAVRGNYS